MKARRLPPIVIGTQVSSQYIKNLMLANGIVAFSIRPNNTSVKVFTETSKKHKKVIKVLGSANVGFHTYTVRGEAKRYRRYLIRGFDTEHPDEEVAAELKERLGEGFVKAHRLNRTNQDGSETRMAPILLITEASVSLQDVKNLNWTARRPSIASRTPS